MLKLNLLKNCFSSEDSGNCQAEVANGQLFNLKPSEYGYVECDDGFTRTGSYYIYCDANGTELCVCTVVMTTVLCVQLVLRCHDNGTELCVCVVHVVITQ